MWIDRGIDKVFNKHKKGLIILFPHKSQINKKNLPNGIEGIKHF